jgi:hypothetical protein
MINTKNIWFCVTSGFMFLMAFNAHADVIKYTLDNLILDDGQQITGTFDWTYNVGDFEGGSGVLTTLEIPYTIYSLAEGSLDIAIETKTIEISGNLNYHDEGLDISLDTRLVPLSPTQSSPIDSSSLFECCGNGFHDQDFRSGTISPSISTAPNPAVFLPAVLGTLLD